ncbi:hypothetical protein QBC43DRAFT_283836 [Cladorrhinum sp. PSN259]|nr:hypothetical protein QBC43DRAFT_283836 [Cladorrhinum sp. PSN259]
MSRSKRNSNFNPDLKTVTVEPGSVTGLYYIPVANASIRSIPLDHGTTWQDLKQFASQVCDVDYADIYSPTSGLVRVKGRENFEKCFEHLNGNILHLRSIQADDRNRDYPTVVRLPQTDFHAARIIEGRTGSSYSHSTHPSYDAAAGTSSTAYQAYSNCTSPPPTANTAWGYNITASSNFGTSTSNDEYMYQSMNDPSATATTTDYAYPSYQPAPSEYDYAASTAPTAVSSSSYQQYQALPPQDSVILDLRKIVILNLERKRLSISYVADIILKYTGIGVQHGEIEKIEVPTNHNGRARGTAYVTFASHDLATATVQALNEREVNGKKLVARLTEGVSRGTVSTGGGEEGGKKKKDKGGGGDGRGQGGDGGQGALVEEGAPVIVDGTVGRGSGRGYW